MVVFPTIRKKKDFNEIFQRGKTIQGGFAVVKFLPNALGNNRFAFMVSHKVSKKAVVRNKVRRRLLESCRPYTAASAGGGKDIIFLALPGIEKKEFSQISRGVAAIIAKITH